MTADACPIVRIAHVCITSTDLEASLVFYREVLGLELRFRFVKPSGEVGGFYLALGNDSFIEIFGRPAKVDPSAVTIRHFCLEVKSIDAVIARLRDHGHDVSDKRLGNDQSWQCWVTDPGGVRIEFHEYTEASFQRTGADCLMDW